MQRGRLVQVARSGRTDAGVHAVAQVAAFSNRGFVRAQHANVAQQQPIHGPPQVVHRYGILEYRIFRGEICSPFERRYVYHHAYRLALEGERLIYRVTGSGFLKHMVRNILGVLLEAGKGNVDRAGFLAHLEPGCEIGAGPTAPARGLFLMSGEY
jgi:tRNA pseudouridine38-40 synthase